jgi:hypothetical protein
MTSYVYHSVEIIRNHLPAPSPLGEGIGLRYIFCKPVERKLLTKIVKLW